MARKFALLSFTVLVLHNINVWWIARAMCTCIITAYSDLIVGKIHLLSHARDAGAMERQRY